MNDAEKKSLEQHEKNVEAARVGEGMCRAGEAKPVPTPTRKPDPKPATTVKKASDKRGEQSGDDS